MLRILALLAAATAAFAAEDAWAKVRALKSGTELRIYKTGARQPVLAKFDEATGESLIIIGKNEQVAIAKDQIERLDYRPPRPGSRINKETRMTTDGARTIADRAKGAGSSVSSGISLESKPDFETIYRRTEPPPKK